MSPAVTPERIAQLITEAPGWARVGLTAPSEGLKTAAADTLGRWVAEGLKGREGAGEDPGQLALPLQTSR